MKRIATLFAVALSLGTGALQAQKSTDANAFQAEIQRLEAQRNAGQLSDEQFDRQILKLKKHYAQAQPAAAPVQRAENGAPATSALVEKRTLVGLYESGKLSEAEFRRAVAALRRDGAETAAPQK